MKAHLVRCEKPEVKKPVMGRTQHPDGLRAILAHGPPSPITLELWSMSQLDDSSFVAGLAML
jgi:hypothetical protein